MRYEVTQYPNGTTDLTLYDVTLLGATSSHPERSADVVSVGMSTASFEALTHDDARRSMSRALDEAQKDVARLSEERDEWKARAEGGLSRAGVGALSGIHRAARLEHAKYPDEAWEFHKSIDALENAAQAAVYEENDAGGYARCVVASVARVLGVDIDEGPGHRWDKDHMERVVAGARELCDELSELKEQAELWRKLAERQDNTAPLRMELRVAERERDEWRSRFEGAKANAEYVRECYVHPDEVEELRTAVVRQAREISRLTGEESE